MEPLSAFVTTYNNECTLAACLESVSWADEVVLLDSYSTDGTLDIAKRFGCRVFQHTFMGYGPQKQMALEHTRHRWVLLLDADEALSPALQEEIREVLAAGPTAAGYTMPRLELMFWQMGSPWAALNGYLRLFDRDRGRLSDMPIHAAPEVNGPTGALKHVFFHFGEVDLHTKVDKVNHYSTGLVKDKLAKGRRANPWIMILYPPLFFFRLYILKRNFLNGWAGFVASVTSAFYVFMKYAKLYEQTQFDRYGDGRLPQGAPPHPRLVDSATRPAPSSS